MNRGKSIVIIMVLLAVVLPAYAETPDECATRLGQDIRIESYAQATAWYDQVWRECAPEPEVTDDGMLPASAGRFSSSTTRMPETGCEIGHLRAELDSRLDIHFSVPTGDEEVHWRYEVAGVWRPFQPREIEATNPPLRGIHQIVLRTNNGADNFGILETWAARYQMLVITC